MDNLSLEVGYNHTFSHVPGGIGLKLRLLFSFFLFCDVLTKAIETILKGVEAYMKPLVEEWMKLVKLTVGLFLHSLISIPVQ